MDEVPPSSQVADAASKIFVSDSDNKRCLNVFAQADMPNRPKLAKALRKGGAQICKDPKDADIVLVDEETEDGRQFIRDWSDEEKKVILHYSWVYQSIARGKMLGEENNWGGFRKRRDENESAETFKSPLPTPRPSPDDLAELQTQRDKLNPPDRFPRTSPLQFAERTAPTIDSTSEAALISNISCDDSAQQSDSAATQANTLNPYSLIFSPYPMQMTAMQGTPSQFPQMMVPQPFLTNQFGQQQSLQQLSRIYAAAADVAMLVGQQYNSNSQNSSTTVPNGRGPTTESASDMNSRSRFALSLSDGAEPSSSALPSSIDRRPVTPSSSTSTPSRQLSSKTKGKQKATSTTSNLHSRTSSSPSTSSPPASLAKFSYIFTSDQGEPLEFWVQIDFPNRGALATIIKKNGGKLQNDRKAADYAVLYSNAAIGSMKYKDFQSLLSASIAEEVPAVNPQFIRDCADQGTLLDHTPYEFHMHSKQKRKRVESNAGLANEEAEKARQKRTKINERRAELRREKKEDDNKASKTKPGTPKGKEKQPNRFRSPSPPAPTPMGFVASKQSYKYTEQERDYLLAYAKSHLETDPTLSNSAIGSAIHKKMPHHSLVSWRLYIGQAVRQEIEEIRKKAGIAYRKTQSQLQTQASLSQRNESDQSDENAENPERGPDLNMGLSRPRGSPLEVTCLPAKLERDLEIVSDFFAYGGGDEDGQDPNIVWSKLTNQATCQTAPTWEEFYNTNHIEIMNRYNEKRQAEDEREAAAAAISVEGIEQSNFDDFYC